MPTYKAMIIEAIMYHAPHGRRCVSYQAIKKYILNCFPVRKDNARQVLITALHKGLGTYLIKVKASYRLTPHFRRKLHIKYLTETMVEYDDLQ